VKMKRTYLLLLGFGLYLCLQAGGVAWSQVTERVSVDSAGNEGDNASAAPSTSFDGRYVAFESQADNLVANDTNTDIDIFVHDRQTEETTRVSVDTAGVQGSGDSNFPSISRDGMHVAFQSDANLDLVAGDTNPFSDIFVRDLLADNTILVSVDSNGFQDIGFSVSPSVSSNGRYVAFESDGNLVFDDTGVAPDIFVHDRDADEDGIYDEPGEVSTVRVSVSSDGTEADQASAAPSISGDGRYVAFESQADNLVAGDTLFPLGFRDVFVRDRDADGDGIYDEPAAISTVRVSVGSTGTEANEASSSASISSDGRYVAFESFADNLVPGDTNGFFDVFVHDRDADGDGIYDEPAAISTVRVSVDSVGVEGDNNSYSPSISSNGRYVAFESNATNLVADDTNVSTDIFVHDRDTDGDGIYDEPGSVSTTRVSVDIDGLEDTGDSNNPSISADGSSVTFQSDADELVAGDTNFAPDIFVDDLQTGAGQGEGSGDGNSGGGCFISTAATSLVW
jgi:Tol biopolymer transport system component